MSDAIAGLLLAAGAGTRLGRPKALLRFRGDLLVDRGIRLLQEAGCRPVHVVLGAAYEEVLRASALLQEPSALHWRTGEAFGPDGRREPEAGSSPAGGPTPSDRRGPGGTPEASGRREAGFTAAGGTAAGGTAADNTSGWSGRTEADGATPRPRPREKGPVVVHNRDWWTGMGSSLRAGLASLPSGVAAVVVTLADQPLIGVEAIRRLRRRASDAPAVVATYQGRPRNPVLLARSVWPDVLALATGDTGARAWLRANPGLVRHVRCDDTGSPADLDTPADLEAYDTR